MLPEARHPEFGPPPDIEEAPVGWITRVLTDVPPAVVYLVVAALVGGETAVLAGVAVPTMTPLLLAGFLARVGSVNPWLIAGVAVAAAIAGDLIGYAEGRRYGSRIRGTRLGIRIGARRWGQADALVQRHGGRSVFLGRLVTVVRTLTPRLVGSAGLPARTFLLWNVPAVLLWASALVGAGYAAGASYARLSAIFGRATVVVLALLGAFVGLAVLGRAVGRHRDPIRAALDRMTGTPFIRSLVGAYGDAVQRLAARYGGRATLVADLGLAVVCGYVLIGGVLGLLVTQVARLSGVATLDRPVMAYLSAHADDRVTVAAGVVVFAFRSVHVLAVVALAAVVSAARSGVRQHPLHVLGTAGVVVPLVVLGLMVESTGLPFSESHRAEPLYPAQTAVLTAGAGILAWLLVRRTTSWRRRLTAMTVAAGAVLLVGAARLYLGLSWPSELAISVLIGSLWNVGLVAAWHTNERIAAAAEERGASR